MNMCDYTDTKKAVKEVLLEENEHGQSFIGAEVNRHVDIKAKQIVFSLTMRFAIPLIAVAVTGTGMWYSLRSDVNGNTKSLNEGGRFTQEEQNVYAKEVDRRFEELNKDIDDIKEDTEAIRKAVTGF